MIRDIVKDQFILKKISTDATKDDLCIVEDLLDTIQANNSETITCVGMAANMIGELKRIMVVREDDDYIIIINPVIMNTFKNSYTTQEGCLCHEGMRETHRYYKIKIEYLDVHFKKKIKTYSGLTAQIIQHEMDHFEGLLI